jgi:phosphoglycerate kinase
MFNKKSIRDIDVRGKRVLVRVDYNVPIAEGKVTDDTRIRAAMPTVEYLLQHGAALILCSHLGRPKDGPDPKYSMRPVAAHLSELLGQPVAFAEDCVGPLAEAAAKALKPGDVLVLENTRFHPEETKNKPEMAQQLAALADIYVNDAFGSAHRAHASTEGVAHILPAVAGFLMEDEIRYLGQAIDQPKRPFVAILGGAKISDKIGVIRNLLTKADQVLIGGGMANTFFKAQGYEIGDSLVEEEALETARELLQLGGTTLRLPVDVVIANRFDAEADMQGIAMGQIPEGWRILDIGPKTVSAFGKVISSAGTVVWNGPMGVFEFPRFAQGTFGVAKLVAESSAISVIGGGDSVAAINQAGLADKITHISTGGGASLEMLEGLELPGLAALLDK